MNMLKSSISMLAFGALLASGCAHNPPKELLDARAAQQQASGGIAQTINPTGLHVAKQSLQAAEAEFDKNGDTERTRDLAYVALRKAQLAEVQARASDNEAKLTALEDAANQRNAQQLAQLRDQYAMQQQQLQASEAARIEAQKRAEQAAADLARIATVKQESRGMVITLSGGVLFASGQATLLPQAQAKLSEVATALTQQDKEARIVVEGYTDSQGKEAFNLDLSARRAQAVRDYLASHGVATDRITSQGLGPARPVADNKTAEGRANNRRVEIVVQPKQAS